MIINSNIQIFKKIPDSSHYIHIDGSLIRGGDYIYLKLNDNQVPVRITRNGSDIEITRVDGMYLIYVDNCSDNYVVYTQYISPLEIEVSVDSIALEEAVFQINNS